MSSSALKSRCRTRMRKQMTIFIPCERFLDGSGHVTTEPLGWIVTHSPCHDKGCVGGRAVSDHV